MFDERFFVYAEEVDLCLRIKQRGLGRRAPADDDDPPSRRQGRVLGARRVTGRLREEAVRPEALRHGRRGRPPSERWRSGFGVRAVPPADAGKARRRDGPPPARPSRRWLASESRLSARLLLRLSIRVPETLLRARGASASASHDRPDGGSCARTFDSSIEWIVEARGGDATPFPGRLGRQWPPKGGIGPHACPMGVDMLRRQLPAIVARDDGRRDIRGSPVRLRRRCGDEWSSSLKSGDVVSRGTVWSVSVSPTPDEVEFWASGRVIETDTSAPFEASLDLAAG